MTENNNASNSAAVPNSEHDLEYGSQEFINQLTDPSYVLRLIKNFILESAYGDMRETVSRSERIASVLALAVYGTWMSGNQLGLTVNISAGDEPATLMTNAAFYLSADASLSLSMGQGRALPIAIEGTDFRTWGLVFNRRISSNRLSAICIRTRIRESVLALPPEIKTLEQIAQKAGTPFEIAYDILKGGE